MVDVDKFEPPPHKIRKNESIQLFIDKKSVFQQSHETIYLDTKIPWLQKVYQ